MVTANIVNDIEYAVAQVPSYVERSHNTSSLTQAEEVGMALLEASGAHHHRRHTSA
jgi:hypothetical protein